MLMLLVCLVFAALALAALSVASRQLATPFFKMSTVTVVVAALNLCGDFWVSSVFAPSLALTSMATIYATLLFHLTLVAYQLQQNSLFHERFYDHRLSVFAAIAFGLPAAPDALLVCVPWYQRLFLPDGFPTMPLLVASLVRPFMQDLPQLAFKAYYLQQGGLAHRQAVLVSAFGSAISLFIISRRICFFKEDRSHLLPPPPVVYNEDVELSEKAVSFAATGTTTDGRSSPTNCWKQNDDICSVASSTEEDDVEDRRMPRYVSKRRIMTREPPSSLCSKSPSSQT